MSRRSCPRPLTAPSSGVRPLLGMLFRHYVDGLEAAVRHVATGGRHADAAFVQHSMSERPAQQTGWQRNTQSGEYQEGRVDRVHL
jgi:hypothetical protein